jgi:NADPH:quinone reductase-like Zn-dependent oxidoreductase
LGVQGTYAQYIEVPARFVLKDKTGLTPEEVATLPVPLATGVRAVKEVGEVKHGDHVLVHSGASGSGSMQIQVAKVLGAQVATTVRDEAKGEYAKSMGADLVINTRKKDFVERVLEWTDGRGADVVIDNLGGDVLPRSIDAVKATGIVVAFGFVAGTQVTFDIRNFFFGQKQLRGSMASDIEDFEWGLEQVRRGKIKPSLDHTLSLKDAAEAHRQIANNEAMGNIVLLPWAA